MVRGLFDTPTAEGTGDEAAEDIMAFASESANLTEIAGASSSTTYRVFKVSMAR